jgi:fatty acid desaturase
MSKTPARALVGQLASVPAVNAILRPPALAWPTLTLIAVVFAAFGLSGWIVSEQLTATNYWHYCWLMPLNAFAVYIAFTPLHDATHGAISRNRTLNDTLGTLSCALFIPGFSTSFYRYLHLEHHRHTGDKIHDPDEFLVTATGWKMPFKLMFVDVVWMRLYLQRWRTRPFQERRNFVLSLMVYCIWHGVFLLSPWALEFILLWLIPQRVGIFMTAYLFARIQHPEHHLWAQDPYRGSAVIRGGSLLRVLMLGQASHNLHHLFPTIPFYRYHLLWRAGSQLISPEQFARRSLIKNDIEWPKKDRTADGSPNI